MGGTAISSGVLSAGTQVYTGRGTLNGVLVAAGATVTVYDNTAASGKKLFEATVAAEDSDQLYDLHPHVRCDIGLNVAVSGGNAIVYYGA